MVADMAKYHTFHIFIFSFCCVSFLFRTSTMPPSRVPQVDVTGYLYHDTVNSATATA